LVKRIPKNCKKLLMNHWYLQLFYVTILLRKLHNLKTNFSFHFLHVYKLKMSYRIEQNDNDIFFIVYDVWRLHFFTIKDRSAIYFMTLNNAIF
jgi:hypothetical protein